MTELSFATAGEALAHYGVKGMRWGERKSAIVSARRNQGRLGDKVGTAEQNYLKARKSGNGAKTAEAQVKLNSANRAAVKNARTAATMTRGEQAAAAILLTPALGLGVIAANKFTTRDSKPIKDYPISILKNVDPEDD